MHTLPIFGYSSNQTDRFPLPENHHAKEKSELNSTNENTQEQSDSDRREIRLNASTTIKAKMENGFPVGPFEVYTGDGEKTLGFFGTSRKFPSKPNEIINHIKDDALNKISQSFASNTKIEPPITKQKKSRQRVMLTPDIVVEGHLVNGLPVGSFKVFRNGNESYGFFGQSRKLPQ